VDQSADQGLGAAATTPWPATREANGNGCLRPLGGRWQTLAAVLHLVCALERGIHTVVECHEQAMPVLVQLTPIWCLHSCAALREFHRSLDTVYP
jgi:hypothetical protein